MLRARVAFERLLIVLLPVTTLSLLKNTIIAEENYGKWFSFCKMWFNTRYNSITAHIDATQHVQIAILNCLNNTQMYWALYFELCTHSLSVTMCTRHAHFYLPNQWNTANFNWILLALEIHSRSLFIPAFSFCLLSEHFVCTVRFCIL